MQENWLTSVVLEEGAKSSLVSMIIANVHSSILNWRPSHEVRCSKRTYHYYPTTGRLKKTV